MSRIKISQLPNATLPVLNDNSVVVLASSGVTNKLSLAVLKQYLGTGQSNTTTTSTTTGGSGTSTTSTTTAGSGTSTTSTTTAGSGTSTTSTTTAGSGSSTTTTTTSTTTRAVTTSTTTAGSGSYNITTTIGSYNTAGCAVGATFTVPVSITMAPGISVGAFNVALDFDSTKLEIVPTTPGGTGYALNFPSQQFPGLQLNNVTSFEELRPNSPYNQTTRTQFRIGWVQGNSPVTFNGILFRLQFRVKLIGSSPVMWDVATPGLCEYANGLGNVIGNVSFVNGNIVC